MRLWHLGLFCLILGAAHAAAVTTPKLARLMVRINGIEKEIDRKEQLELVRGDELTLLYAVLEKSSQAPDIINFVGYRGEGPRRWADDDRDILIPTDNLKKGWSLDKTGRTYKIEARTGTRVHGEILVNIINPELKSIRLDIKGVEHDLNPGDVLDIGAADPIKVVDVKTNSAVVDRAIRMEFKEAGQQVELRLLYRSYAFASVFLNRKE